MSAPQLHEGLGLTCGIYEIVNKVNGKRYVGSSVDIEARWRAHRRSLLSESHHSIVFQRAWNKYGEEMFDWGVILECEYEDLHAHEQREIDMKSEYNISPTAGSNRGMRWTDEQKNKHKLSKREYYSNWTDEQRAEFSLLVKESSSRPEVRMAISEGTRRGQSDPAVREKLAANTRARWMNNEYREAMSDQARRMINRPSHKAAVIAANRRPKNLTIYNFNHPDHGDRTCTQWSLKNEFKELRSGNISQLCSGEKKSHKGWTIKKAPEGA